MNLRLNIILLCIAVALGGWFISQQFTDNTELADLIKKEGMPEYTGAQLTSTIYDPNGKPQYFAQAEEIKRYEETDRTEFLKPLLNLFDEKTALKQWKITADHAEISKERMLHLQGNVKIESLDPNSRLQKIETAQLSIDLTTHDIRSEAQVRSIGMGFTTTGTGLTGNLKQQTATLLNNVKTSIEPTVVAPKQ